MTPIRIAAIALLLTSPAMGNDQLVCDSVMQSRHCVWATPRQAYEHAPQFWDQTGQFRDIPPSDTGYGPTTGAILCVGPTDNPCTPTTMTLQATRPSPDAQRNDTQEPFSDLSWRGPVLTIKPSTTVAICSVPATPGVPSCDVACLPGYKIDPTSSGRLNGYECVPSKGNPNAR